MARFSLGRDDDLNENPTNNNNSSTHKRLRTTTTTSSSLPEVDHQDPENDDEEVVEAEETGDMESEEDEDEEEDDDESDEEEVDDEPEEDSIPLTIAAIATTSSSLPEEDHQDPQNDEELVEAEEIGDVESEEDEDEEEDDESDEEDDDESEEDSIPSLPEQNHQDPENDEEVVEAEETGDVESSSSEEEDEEEDDESEWDSIPLTLIDMAALCCPICCEPLTIPVFQCENGHIACASCCIKKRIKCQSCSRPIGYKRCWAIEKVIGSVKISCRNMEYGCKETVLYSKKYEHENSCIYAPCSCPVDNCYFLGSSKNLYEHFAGRHLNSAKHFDFNSLFPINLETSQKCLILREQKEGIIFVLNHSSEGIGSAFNVICIGSVLSKKRFWYDIISTDGDSRLKFQSFAESIPKWSAIHRLKKYLLVPSDFIGSCSQIKLEVCIRRRDQ